MDYRELFFKIRTVAHLHRKQLDEVVSEADLHFGQLPILATLSRLETASQKAIAKELHVSAPSIANSVKRMEKKGLLICDVKEDDRRSHVLQLTKKGQEAKQYCFERFQSLDKQICQRISQEDIVIFEKVLNIMMEQLKEEGENND